MIARRGTLRVMLPGHSADVRETAVEVWAGPDAGWVTLHGVISVKVGEIVADSVPHADIRVILGDPKVKFTPAQEAA